MTAFATTSAPRAEHLNPAGPLHERISKRWSPFGFSGYTVQDPDLVSLFAAARWAASSYAEQTWTYRVASQSAPEEFGQLLSCLVPANQQWAKAAPVLVLNIVSRRTSPTTQDNRAALHELGFASAHLARQATSHGLCVHQVIGIFAERARELYGIPEHFEAWTAMAIGYDESSEKSRETSRPRPQALQTRRTTSTFVVDHERGNLTPTTV